MFRTARSTAVAALLCVVAGPALAGCSETAADAPAPVATAAADQEPITGRAQITVEGRSVTVSCTGAPVADRPVVVLLAGLGDGLDRLAAFQETLSRHDRVCSYDRLGEGASDAPDGPQTFESTGAILTGVLDRVAGDGQVVLAGHSLGGLIAARYAPAHTDRVAGLVLMDATPASIIADTAASIPESATGPAAELRAQSTAVYGGETPERLVVQDGEVGYAGDIAVEVIQHGRPYLADIPEYGAALEAAWAEGQRAWLDLSSRSTLTTAADSGHYIYLDRPDVADAAVERVTAGAAG